MDPRAGQGFAAICNQQRHACPANQPGACEAGLILPIKYQGIATYISGNNDFSGFDEQYGNCTRLVSVKERGAA